MNLFSGIQSEIVRKAARKCAEFLIYVLCCAMFAHRVKIPRMRVCVYPLYIMFCVI